MAEDHFQCSDMKKITLEKVLAVLKNGSDPVEVDRELADASMPPLKRMLELSK